MHKNRQLFLTKERSCNQACQNRKDFSKLECKSGFWQIKMEVGGVKYTGFHSPQGFYEWNVIPLGLKNAPRIFQRRIDDAFKHLNSFLVGYVDEV